MHGAVEPWSFAFVNDSRLARFPYGVNSGIGRSKKVLQRVVGVAAGGALGDETMKGVAAHLPSKIIIETCDEGLSPSRGRWYTAQPRLLFALAFIVYVWKVVVFDKVLGWGTTDPLSGGVAQWATIVLTAYFRERSLEKVRRILARK